MTLTIILSLTIFILLAPVSAAAEDLVESTLRSLNCGSAKAMQEKIFTTPIATFGPRYRQSAIAALPDQVREKRVRDGNLRRRIEWVMDPILQIHNRTGSLELFLYRGDQPAIFVWRGCVLVISDLLATFLKDEELAGIIAHELGHAYFMDETVRAQSTGDAQVMRAVELKCDAVAMLTLKLMGRDPEKYLSGLWKLTSQLIQKGYPANSWWHPRIAERDRFAHLFIRLLNR